MIVSSSLKVGQITFILRVAIQILSYLGLFIVNILILGHAPRVASLATHDILNRLVGSSSATTTTVKWISSRLRRNKADSLHSTDLLLILFLSLSYTAFVALSDIGFLGFHACSVPGPSTSATPASVDSADKAQQFIAANMPNGTQLSLVKAYHCDSTSVISIDDILLNNCTSWRNGTYADSKFFSGLNSTDSTVLMPSELMLLNSSMPIKANLNSFFFGPTTQRVREPVLERGLAIVPHATGVRTVVGVPQLGPNTKIELPKTMAIEIDVGCMSLGVEASHSKFEGTTFGYEYFRMNDSWMDYTGPDYMKSALLKTVEDIRVYLQPLFNTSTLDSNGNLKSINETNLFLSPVAYVGEHSLPRAPGPEDYFTPNDILRGDNFMGNCTEVLRRQLNLSVVDHPGTMCALYGIGGTRTLEGEPSQVFHRMVCAATTQVNMVAATVQVDILGAVSLNISYLPSDLTHVVADYWNIGDINGSTTISSYTPYERYTLSDSANSRTMNFIPHRETSPFCYNDCLGPGTAGNVISYMGHAILDLPNQGLLNDDEYPGLMLLDEGFEDVTAGSGKLSEWVGQLGGSFIVGSLSYNGWAALQATPIEVLSTGGQVGSCYRPLFALGFVPLVFSAMIIICWAIPLLCRGSWVGSRPVNAAYGGMSPYTSAICPGAPAKNTLAAWESSPQTHLRILSQGSPVVGDANVVAIEYFKPPTLYE